MNGVKKRRKASIGRAVAFYFIGLTMLIAVIGIAITVWKMITVGSIWGLLTVPLVCYVVGIEIWAGAI